MLAKSDLPVSDCAAKSRVLGNGNFPFINSPVSHSATDTVWSCSCTLSDMLLKLDWCTSYCIQRVDLASPHQTAYALVWIFCMFWMSSFFCLFAPNVTSHAFKLLHTSLFSWYQRPLGLHSKEGTPDAWEVQREKTIKGGNPVFRKVIARIYYCLFLFCSSLSPVFVGIVDMVEKACFSLLFHNARSILCLFVVAISDSWWQPNLTVNFSAVLWISVFYFPEEYIRYIIWPVSTKHIKRLNITGSIHRFVYNRAAIAARLWNQVSWR